MVHLQRPGGGGAAGTEAGGSAAGDVRGSGRASGGRNGRHLRGGRLGLHLVRALCRAALPAPLTDQRLRRRAACWHHRLRVLAGMVPWVPPTSVSCWCGPLKGTTISEYQRVRFPGHHQLGVPMNADP